MNRIPWRLSKCGGARIHGTDKCCEDPGGGWVCFCQSIPTINYELKYEFVMEIEKEGLHLDNSRKK
jgi:hypothetical protein